MAWLGECLEVAGGGETKWIIYILCGEIKSPQTALEWIYGGGNLRLEKRCRDLASVLITLILLFVPHPSVTATFFNLPLI